MKKLFLGLILTCFISVSFAQVKKLQDYIEKGHSFEEICKKADKMIRKNKIEHESYREGNFRNGNNKKEYLDDEKLKFERWKWYWRDRLTEEGKFPDLQRQWALYNQITHESKFNTRSPTEWKREGPVKNTGGYWGMGRATHVDFHPSLSNVFYVASPNGGLWKTTDNGLTYESIADNLPYQPVGIVIVDPHAPNTLYITLGEKDGWWQYSMGVYKTTDGGKTWNPTGLNWKLTDNKVIYALEMNPINTAILMAATSDGIYKTWNGGNTWSKIRTENFSDLKFKPGDTSVVYAALNDYWGECNVFKSIDGGNTFSKSSNFALQKVFLRLAITKANSSYVGVNMSVDGGKKFYLSKNNAQSFEYVSDPPENSVLYFSQNNQNILYCGYTVIFKSEDQGQTWNQITNWWNSGTFPEVHADHHFISHNPIKKDELYFCCDGGLYRLHENTGQWDELVSGLAVTQFYKLGISTTNPPVIIGGSQDNGGWVKHSNGTWGNTNGGDAMSQIVDPTNQNIGYTEYWGGNAVYRSTDGFYNFDDITQNIGAELPGQWVTPFSLNPKNPKTFIIGYNNIFISHDRGNTFDKITDNLTGSKDNDLRDVKISPVDTNLIIATRGNYMYISKDYGKVWKTSVLASPLEITGFEFHPKDTNRMWCTRGGYGTIKVMTTKDRGNTWTNITKNFVNTPVTCIIYDEPTNNLFVGTDFGVFFSDADSVSWQYYGTDLPHTTVTDLKIHKTLRKLYASTYGRGFYSIDLPECASAQLDIQVSVDGGDFISKDSINLCLGSSVVLRVQDSLKGSFRWRNKIVDTTILNFTVWNAGIFSNINKTGSYILEYYTPNGCVSLDTIYIRVFSKPNFKLQSSYAQLDCNHLSLVLKPSISKDTSIYSYEWLDPDSALIASYEFLISKPGKYYFTLKNQLSNCSYYDSIEIIQYLNPTIKVVSINQNRCFGDSTGSVSVQGLSGKPPYLYKWSDQSISNSRTSLKSGIYILSLTDSNQCIEVDTIQITEPSAFDVNLKISASSGTNGIIEIDISGATPPYLFEWSVASQVISNTKDLYNLPPGMYDLKITDSLGCVFTKQGIKVNEIVSTSKSIAKTFYLYPNPAKDYLNLKFKENIDANFRIELVNLQGKVMPCDGKRITDQRNMQIRIDQLPPGWYFVKLYKNNLFEKVRFSKI